jgi:hypothetical protein
VARWPSVAAEFLAHEHLQQHVADRFDGGVCGSKSSIVPPRSSMSMRSRTRIAAFAGREMAANTVRLQLAERPVHASGWQRASGASVVSDR